MPAPPQAAGGSQLAGPAIDGALPGAPFSLVREMQANGGRGGSRQLIVNKNGPVKFDLRW